MRIYVSRYYETVTEESAQDGDVADRGEVYTDRLMSIRETIEEIRQGGFTEPSSSHVHAGVWLTQPDSEIDYRTGEHRTESLHFKRDRSPHDTKPAQLTAHQTRRLLRAAGVRIRG